MVLVHAAEYSTSRFLGNQKISFLEFHYNKKKFEILTRILQLHLHI